MIPLAFLDKPRSVLTSQNPTNSVVKVFFRMLLLIPDRPPNYNDLVAAFWYYVGGAGYVEFHSRFDAVPFLQELLTGDIIWRIEKKHMGAHFGGDMRQNYFDWMMESNFHKTPKC